MAKTRGRGNRIIQIRFGADVSDRSTTSTIPDDDTIPQTTEMISAISLIPQYTPISPHSVTYIFGIAHMGASGGMHSVIGLKDAALGSNNMSSVARCAPANSSQVITLTVAHRFVHTDLTTQNWRIYFGGTLGGTKHYNRNGIGARFGNTFQAILMILEVLEDDTPDAE